MHGPVRLVLLAALVLPLRLFPPGRSGQAAAPGSNDTVLRHMPGALRNGSRTPSVDPTRYLAHAAVGPSPARLGQRLTYRANVLMFRGTRLRFTRPASDETFAWGAPRAGKLAAGQDYHPPLGYFIADSFFVEIPLQVFTTGAVAIPGPEITFSVDEIPGKVFRGRLPTVRLMVLPSITEADTNATLRPVRGPLGAPWWERVPWLLVSAIAAVVALLVWAVARMRRKPKRVPVAPPVVAPRVVRDPSAEALDALARLRAEGLPGQGRFGEHALGLTRILRRYLEATLVVPLPGDTSGELLARLRATKLAPEDLRRLEGLLGLWDRVKFARAPMDAAEAGRCEGAVEELVRRRESPREVA